MPFNPSKDIPDLSGKVILITGGTSGIGKAAVLALAAHKPSHIYFTGRNPDAGSAVVSEVKQLTPTCPTTFIPCDLSSSRDTIRDALVQNFKSPRLDLFIANAGVMAIAAGTTIEGYEVQFGTNYMGHAIMLKLLRPLMLRTAANSSGVGETPNPDVRFIALSSYGHVIHPAGGIDFPNLRSPDGSGGPTGQWTRYGQSKLADILLAKAMSKHHPTILSVSLHPGMVRTDLGPRAEKSGFIKIFIDILRYIPWLLVSPEKGAYNTLWAVGAKREGMENGGYYDPVGKLAGRANKFASGMDEIAKDEGLVERLWEWTEKELEGLEEL